MEAILKDVFEENATVDVRPALPISQTDFVPIRKSDAKLNFIVSRNNIDVKLINQDPVSALRFEIEFKSNFIYRPITLIPRIQSLNSCINFRDNFLKIAILDLDGKGLPVGAGTIASIPVESSQEFQVAGAYASSKSAGVREIPYSIIAEDESDSNVLQV